MYLQKARRPSNGIAGRDNSTANPLVVCLFVYTPRVEALLTATLSLMLTPSRQSTTGAEAFTASELRSGRLSAGKFCLMVVSLAVIHSEIPESS